MSGIIRKILHRSASPGTMAEATKKAQQLIDENAVVVFSKSYCPYCQSTKRTLKKSNAKFEVLELDQASDGSAIQDALEELTGQRTVPNIFIKQEHIGGNSDLQSLSSAGQLDALLKEAGALSV